MDRLSFVRRQFACQAWAHDRVIAALAASGSPAPDAVRLLGHILTSSRVWLDRLHGKDMLKQDFWPGTTLDACRDLAGSVHADYRTFLESLPEKDLDSLKPYRNSKGIPFETRVEDVLAHVAAHDAYHRGQIASAMRAAGAAPVNTDFITFVREASGK